MSLCSICNMLLLENDKKAELPCGCANVHSHCLIKDVCRIYGIYNKYTCNTCSYMHYEDNFYAPSNVIMENNPDFDFDLKRLKPIKQKFMQNLKIFNNKLKNSFEAFKNEIHTHLTYIKSLKANIMKEIRSSSEYKLCMSSTKVYTRAINIFKIKHNTSTSELRKLKIIPKTHSFYHSKVSNILKRKFRLRF